MSTHLPHPYELITSVISQLGTIDFTSSASVPSLSTLRRDDLKSAKSIFTTLHFLFPHELLPALDLLDRKLVTQLVVILSRDNCESTTTPHAKSDPPTLAGQQKPWEIFYVQSASAIASSSKSNSRYRRVYNPTCVHYEVRLDAWNCTCPAFAYSAFGGVSDLGYEQASSEDRHAQIDSETVDSGGEWQFGGKATRQGTGAPICKHLLAAMLGKALPGLFGNGVQRKEVTAAEAAGWSGGWGD